MYLEQTIRSVLLQGYPNLEYLVIDGGSTDSSVDVIRRYQPWLRYWVSERDRGQSAAINKGFARATGDIYGYLNSDDFYQPNALPRVARDFQEGPAGLHAYHVVDVHDGAGPDTYPAREQPTSDSRRPHRRPVVQACDPDRLDSSPRGVEWRDSLVPLIVGELYFHQPGVFWPADAYREVGGFDDRYTFLFDQKFFLELLLTGMPLICHGGEPVAAFRHHAQSKTIISRRQEINPFSLELWRIARELEPELRQSERDVVRRKRVAIALSRVWRELRSGRRGAVRALVRGLVDHPDIVTDRFFWSTLLAVGGIRRVER
jgi:glycosyltransferase involved in cell wall biosynthesis